MIHKSNGSGRRLLTFPAVHPCEAIAPTTLLSSLISLARSISSYKSKFFASNNRNARETLRQIGNLLIFLEEIRDGSSDLSDSVILSLSELHLTFQKIQYLLEDCTREGARLWMLMKSDRVANHFRVLIRSISTGLDVFPLGSTEVSVDVKELIDLVMRQARETNFEVDQDDKRVIETVKRITNQFEGGVIPDQTELERVLDYLRIRKWSECNKEVKFLDAEIGTEYLNVENRRELGFLSSLMGFMSYCRCAMFDSVDREANQQPIINFASNSLLQFINPDDFRCPISLEFMTDPVTLSTGHTYDRSSISKWFKSGNPTCPKTAERLTSTGYVSNLVLKQLIQQYCSENAIPFAESGHKSRDITRTVLPGSLAAEGAMKMAASFLAGRLENGTCKERNKAAYEIRVLSKTSIFNRSCLVEAGSIPNLLNLLSSTDSSTQENSMAALLNLSKHSKSKSLIMENNGLDLIVQVLKNGLRVEAQQHAAATLFYLASIEDYRKLIGENLEAIPTLVKLIKDGNARCKKNALVAIFGLLMHPNNHRKVLSCGAVSLLLDLLKSPDREDLLTDSLAVLATLAEKPDGTSSILSHGGLSMIVEILDSSISRTGKEYCVSLLLALCINGGANTVALLVKSPWLMGSLYSLLSEGTSRASKKASALIRLLHEYYERRSSGSMAPFLPQERSVHVW